MKFNLSDFLQLDTKGLLAVNGGYNCNGSTNNTVYPNTYYSGNGESPNGGGGNDHNGKNWYSKGDIVDSIPRGGTFIKSDGKSFTYSFGSGKSKNTTTFQKNPDGTYLVTYSHYDGPVSSTGSKNSGGGSCSTPTTGSNNSNGQGYSQTSSNPGKNSDDKGKKDNTPQGGGTCPGKVGGTHIPPSDDGSGTGDDGTGGSGEGETETGGEELPDTDGGEITNPDDTNKDIDIFLGDKVIYHKDGRIQVDHSDGSHDFYYPDGTHIHYPAPQIQDTDTNEEVSSGDTIDTIELNGSDSDNGEISSEDSEENMMGSNDINYENSQGNQTDPDNQNENLQTEYLTPDNPDDVHCDIIAWNHAVEAGLNPRGENGTDRDANHNTVDQIFNEHFEGQDVEFNGIQAGRAGYLFYDYDGADIDGNIEFTHVEFVRIHEDGMGYSYFQNVGFEYGETYRTESFEVDPNGHANNNGNGIVRFVPLN